MKYSSTVLFNPLNKSNIGNILMFYFHGRSYKTSIQFSFVYSQKYCGILINRWPPPPPTLILRMSPFLISSTTASFLMRRSCDGSTALRPPCSPWPAPGPALVPPPEARCSAMLLTVNSSLRNRSAWLLGFRPRSGPVPLDLEIWKIQTQEMKSPTK